MGLDNSFTLHITDTAKFGKLPNWLVRSEWEIKNDKPNDVEVELLYWRKCWNVRGKVFDTLDFENRTIHIEPKEGSDWEPYDYEILVLKSLDDYEKILDVLMKELYSFEKWDNEDGSIWEWVDIEPKILEDGSESEWMKVNNGVCDIMWREMAMANRWLEFLRNKDPDSYYIHFIDSY